MLKMYERSEAKLNQQLENISDIGQMAGIQLEFLKDGFTSKIDSNCKFFVNI